MEQVLYIVLSSKSKHLVQIFITNYREDFRKKKFLNFRIFLICFEYDKDWDFDFGTLKPVPTVISTIKDVISAKQIFL